MEEPSFFRLMRKEFSSLPRNKMLILNACFMVALVFLIGFLYRAGALKSIPLVVADLDQSSTSRIISQGFSESEKFTVTQVSDYPAALEMIKEGKAIAGLVIPEDLSADIKNQKGTELLLIIDGTNYIAANTAYAKASEILQTLNAGIALETLQGKGFLPDEAQATVQRVILEQKILYNPDYNYAYYLSYGVFSAGIFSLAMSAIALTLCRQKRTHHFSLGELGAKIITYGVFASVVTNIIFRLAEMVFKLPARGSLGSFFALTLPYGLLIAVFALMLFSLAREEVRIFQAAVFFATPLFFVTGYTWPFQSIPDLLRPVYYLNPLTPFLNGARACLVMGADWGVLAKYVVWQLGLVTLYLPCAFLFYKSRTHRSAC
ncbi:ABC transporter permease [Candidatus Formimonas warabiya]|uniref:ABC-2 type transporter transmembrane domain-containing protein n=1 Tax=Formimonas warabiya TaxID=1761012 RepID=A0A3G1KU51_FORW1|nr:ABC transporter permease [Candidatus Formimonas warabiya]ATW25960.1 hypothetical protein DCMF_15300 [Candidatus Formimonas warabiya]